MRTLQTLPLPFLLGAALSTLSLSGCGDDEKSPDVQTDAGVVTTVDAAVPPTDAPTDAPPSPFVPPTPVAVPLSAAGPDQLQSAVAAPGGGFYAAGFVGATIAGPRLVTVVKLTAAGALDPTFSGDGIAATTLDFKGGAGEVGIGVQPSGKIVVSATVANPVTAADRDVAVARLNTDGTPDLGFGVGGVRLLDLSTATSTTAPVSTDAARGVAIGAAGLIHVYAVQRGVDPEAPGAPRTDTDFAVVRLTADGGVDSSYGTGGKYLLDIQRSNATPRGIQVLADGSVIGSGYANSEGVGSTVQPVLFKLTPAGVPDTAFAGGFFHSAVLQVQTEIYGVAVHGNQLVTGGYGRDSGASTLNDYVSMRFDATTGARDLTWGGAARGAVLIDASGAMVGDNCRGALALPGGKTLLFGSTGPNDMPVQDAVLAVLDATGRLDTAFGDGLHTFPLGANGNDQFWGAAVSGNQALLVGYKGGGPAAMQTDTVNDDAYAVILPMP